MNTIPVVNPLTISVPEEFSGMMASEILKMVFNQTMFEKKEDGLNFMQAVFSATSNQNDWRYPVCIQTHNLSGDAIEWVKAAIVWYQAAEFSTIKVSVWAIQSPGYQAW